MNINNEEVNLDKKDYSGYSGPRWVIERRLWPETPPHSSCPLSSRWSGTCYGRPESRLLNIFFPASQPSDPRIFPRKKKQGEGNYKSFDLSQIADETFSAFTNSFCWWSMAGRGSLLILWENAGSSQIYILAYITFINNISLVPWSNWNLLVIW